MPPEARLSLTGLTLRAGDRALLSEASLTVRSGELVALVGPSGAGKSLLVRALLGLRPPGSAWLGGRLGWQRAGEEGEIDLQDGDPTPVRGRVGSLVAQHARDALDPLRTVGQQITSVARRAGQPEAPLPWLTRVGLPPRAAGLYPHELSGGMATRAALAQGLALGSPLLLADEPLSGLDPIAAQGIVALLLQLVADGHGVLWVTHHLQRAAQATRLVRVDGGRTRG